MKLFRFPMFAAFLPTLRLCAYLMSIILVIAVPASASAQTGGALPAAAQDALDNGILAAKVPDYLLAIRYFEDARKLAPDAPVIYLNLGVAESKIPSRELRAMAWLGAYLAALPNAANAAAVKEEINVLKVRNQSNVSHMIKAAQDAANRGSWDKISWSWKMREVSTLWAKSGDIAAALSIADLPENGDKDFTLEEISVVQAAQGDVPGAKTTANLIQRAEHKTETLIRIGSGQTDAKDVRGARVTFLSAFRAAGLIEILETRGDKLNALARAQIDAGDIPAAHETLVSALESAELSPADAHIKVRMQLQSGDAYIQMHDVASAKAVFSSAYNNSKLVDDAAQRSYEQSDLATSQAKAGDLANAAQSLSAAQTSANRVQGERKTFMLGQVAGARVHFAEAQTKSAVAYLPVALPPTPASDLPPRPIIRASDWLKVLDSNSQNCCAGLNSAPFLDLAAYLKSLPASDDPQKVFDGLFNTAERLVGTQTAVVGMLNHQLPR